MIYSDYIIYVDESGDHNLERTNPAFPVFALTFCIFRKDDYVAAITPAIQRLKFKYFGHNEIVLHEREIRKQEPPFTFLKSEIKRQLFMEDLNAIVEAAPMTIIASVIDKESLRRQYEHPSNPYEIALLFCIERSFGFLKDLGQRERVTHVIVEKRGRQEDAALELQFLRVLGGHNRWGPMNGFDIVFVDKKANSSGLQLADLTARPIGLKVLRPRQQNRAFDVIETKFRRSPDGKTHGWGFKVFPRKSERPRYTPEP
jgi:hypothetical protein